MNWFKKVGITLFCMYCCTLQGCRTTRPEVPPPPRFASDGRKQPLNAVGFGSVPRPSFMTDATAQIAPGIKAPGQDQTSIASREAYQPDNPSTDQILKAPDPTKLPQQPAMVNSDRTSSKGLSLGGIMKGLGNGSASNRDSSVVRAGGISEGPSSTPLDPPVTLPPPPLVPPPAAIAPPALPADGRVVSEHAPSALPSQNALPPLLPEGMP